MRKPVFTYSLVTSLFALLALLLRRIELNTALDPATMLMRFSLPSALLLLCCLAAVIFAFYMSRGLPAKEDGGGYDSRFSSLPGLVFACLSALLLFFGSVMLLSNTGKVLERILSVLAPLAALGWCSLSLNGWRNRFDRCDLLSGIWPVLFCCFFLICIYQGYAPQPALLFTLYPFLGLCAAAAGLHFLLGCAVRICRPRAALLFCGIGAVLCAAAIPTVRETPYRAFLLALTVQLIARSSLLLKAPARVSAQPQEPEAEVPEAGDTTAGQAASEDVGHDDAST